MKERLIAEMKATGLFKDYIEYVVDAILYGLDEYDCTNDTSQIIRARLDSLLIAINNTLNNGKETTS